jgi:microcystin-dependent protein
MSSPFVGEIRNFGFNFAPKGWALCNGQILSIAQNTALFSLLGTMYGGNGTTTFALPNLQGRRALHQGSGPGLTPHTIGEAAGAENSTLVLSQLPMHNHPLAEGTTSTTKNPTGKYLGLSSGGAGYTSVKTGVMAADAVGLAGSSQPFTRMDPYLVTNYCIALFGVFPSRN